jgi:hypothetical protein
LWIELQRLDFSGFARKKAPALAGAFLCVFAGVLGGVLQNWVFFGWYFVVVRWW